MHLPTRPSTGSPSRVRSFSLLLSPSSGAAVGRALRVFTHAVPLAPAATADFVTPDMPSTLVWFSQDLRLDDNAALAAAVARGHPVVPVYVWDDAPDEPWRPGAASRWWLHHSLAALAAALEARGSRLVIARGNPTTVLVNLARDTGATAVYWNRRYEPAARRTQEALRPELSRVGVDAQSFAGALLFEPEAVRNRSGGPFQVFTPFWRHCQTLPVPSPVTLPKGTFRAPARWPASVPLDKLSLLPRIRWDAEFLQHGTPGEDGAARRLRQFVGESLARYGDDRDFPATAGTSGLSAHLHFGEITPRQIWSAVAAEGRDRGVFPPNRGAAVFLAEVGWREFAYHLLWHFPHTPERPLRAAFEAFPWADDPGGRLWTAWRTGRTGYPIVDAGLRQLWRTGWMHNRVRMIAASFLVKHLRLPWQQGAGWFWDTLVDADLASNTLGWQWSAGCGADAAPYFRIFAPVTQGRKFDPDGAYVRRWLPELARLPSACVHAPWEASPTALAEAGVRLGKDYPLPVVDHATARADALAAFKKLRHSAGA